MHVENVPSGDLQGSFWILGFSTAYVHVRREKNLLKFHKVIIAWSHTEQENYRPLMKFLIGMKRKSSQVILINDLCHEILF